MEKPSKQQIKNARNRLHLTQTAFGELVDSKLRTVQSWESGDRNMPPLKWKIIQDILKRQNTSRMQPEGDQHDAGINKPKKKTGRPE